MVTASAAVPPGRPAHRHTARASEGCRRGSTSHSHAQRAVAPTTALCLPTSAVDAIAILQEWAHAENPRRRRHCKWYGVTVAHILHCEASRLNYRKPTPCHSTARANCCSTGLPPPPDLLHREKASQPLPVHRPPLGLRWGAGKAVHATPTVQRIASQHRLPPPPHFSSSASSSEDGICIKAGLRLFSARHITIIVNIPSKTCR